MKRFLAFMLVCILVSACVPANQTAIQPTPLPLAPTGLSSPASDATLSVGSLGVNGMQVTMTPSIVPEAIPAPYPPGVTVIHITAPASFFDQLKYVQSMLNDPNNKGKLNDAMFIGGILGAFLRGISPANCTGYADSMYSHLVDDNGGYRLRRLGGFAGVQSFLDSLANGKYEVRAIVSSFNLQRALFWIKEDGQDVLIIFSKEGRSTVIPIITSDEAEKLVSNFLIKDDMGIVEKGMVFGTKEAGQLLGVGVYVLDAAMIGDTLKSLATLGKCLDERFMKNPDFASWRTRHSPSNASDDQQARFTYMNEQDLVADLALMDRLGISTQIVDSQADGRIVAKMAFAVGGAVILIQVVPIAVGSISVAGLTDASFYVIEAVPAQ